MQLEINGQQIEILAVNFSGNSFDWRRLEGYTGACVSECQFSSFEAVETEITAVLQNEIGE